MSEIIPAILTNDSEELVRLAHIFERAGVTRVHLDICDGQFVPARTISGYEELARLQSSLRWDVHLMVQQPDARVDQWHQCACVDRFIVHLEAVSDMALLAEHAHGHGQELWAARNPETPLERLDASMGIIDGVQFMTVHPGEQARPFLPEVIADISGFHAMHGAVPIMVDGGITPETAPQCIAAGATQLVSGSYIVQSDDPAQAIARLTEIL